MTFPSRYWHEGRVRGYGTRANTHNSRFGPFATREEAQASLDERTAAHRSTSKRDGSGRYWRGFIREERFDNTVDCQ